MAKTSRVGLAALGIGLSALITVTDPQSLAARQGPSLPANEQRGSEIFARVEQANAFRERALQSYESTREYTVLEPGHEPDANLVVSMQFVAPATKTFGRTSAQGVGWIHKRVFRGLMNAEQEAATGKDKASSALTPENYVARLVGEDRYGGRECFVLALQPKTENKYLLTASVWIDKEDFAIAKIEGDPIKSPSFWVERAHLVREYQRIGGFWLPLRDQTLCRIRLVGDYMLRIRYLDYRITSATTLAAQSSPGERQ